MFLHNGEKLRLGICACDGRWVWGDCCVSPAKFSWQLLANALVIWDVLTCISGHTCRFLDQQSHHSSGLIVCDSVPHGFLGSAIVNRRWECCLSHPTDLCAFWVSVTFVAVVTNPIWWHKKGPVYFDWQFKDTVCYCVEISRQYWRQLVTLFP